MAGERASEAQYGSDYIVEMLRALGIRYTAFNPGATFRGIHDSLVNFGDTASPEIIQACHEEISVAIAHGYARASGQPMAAIVHDVVGLQHASMAIFNAWIDRVPVLVMGATGPMDSTRRRPHIDWIHTALVQGNLVRDYTKFDDQPASLRAVPDSMMRAYRTMMTEPRGPVYVCFDADVQEDQVAEPLPLPDVRQFVDATRPQADPRALAAAADMLVNAKRPVLYASMMGRNQESVASLQALAELLAASVVVTEERFNFPTTHPLNVSGAAAKVLAEADVILALDAWDLHSPLTTLDRTTRTMVSLKGADTRIIQITLADYVVRSWTSDYHALYPTDLSIVADTALALPALVEEVRKRQLGDRSARFEEIKAQHESIRAKWKAQAESEADARPISLAYMAAEVWKHIQNEDWVLAYHSFNPWPGRLWSFTKPYQYSSGSGGGGVGYGIGGSIGAALAHRGTGRILVDLQADGDLLYATSALWTVSRYDLPLLMVMHNNRSYYNSEEHGGNIARHRGRPVERKAIGTQIVEPAVDFATVARGFGIAAEGPIEDPSELGAAIGRALEVVKHGKPALVDVVTNPR